jgi:hypothetical protein
MRRDTSKRYPPVTQEPRFLDPTLPMVLPQKTKNAYQRGKASRRSRFAAGRICDPTLLFQAQNGTAVKIGFLKCPRARFLLVSAIMTFGNPAAISGVELVRRSEVSAIVALTRKAHTTELRLGLSRKCRLRTILKQSVLPVSLIFHFDP